MSSQAVTLISVVVLIIVALRFDLYCLKDLAQAEVVLYFPPRIWTYIIVLSTPLGGITYLMLGKPR
jgi:hypothetical protein